jgi:hypothetical protein
MECPCCGQLTDGAIKVEFLKEVNLQLGPHIVLCKFVDSFPRVVSKDAMVDELYSLSPDGGPDTANRVIDVYLTKIRQAIRPLGWNVVRVTSGRYKLIPDEMK